MKTTRAAYITGIDPGAPRLAGLLAGFLLNSFWLVGMIIILQRIWTDRLNGIPYTTLQNFGLGLLGIVFFGLFPIMNLALSIYSGYRRSGLNRGMLITFLAVPPILVLVMLTYALGH